MMDPCRKRVEDTFVGWASVVACSDRIDDSTRILPSFEYDHGHTLKPVPEEVHYRSVSEQSLLSKGRPSDLYQGLHELVANH